jgi:CTP:molybdopterin cytidylyltransferase MocA
VHHGNRKGDRVTAGLLLAAGAGRRYGMPKALVPHGDRLLVEHGLDTLRGGGCAPVVVVLGAAADEVRQRADLTGATVIVNPDWAQGMGSSLRAGLDALAGAGVGVGVGIDAAAGGGTDLDAAVILLVDTPWITPEAVRRVRAHSGPRTLAVATYHGERGHPVLLGRAHWRGAAALATGDVGARPYLQAHAGEVVTVPCEDIADGTDVDEPTQPDRHSPTDTTQPTQPNRTG